MRVSAEQQQEQDRPRQHDQPLPFPAADRFRKDQNRHQQTEDQLNLTQRVDIGHRLQRKRHSTPPKPSRMATG